VSRSKFRNVRTEVDGISFASKAEAKRYQELKLLEKAGEIMDLRLQPRYDVHFGDHKICTYVGDFEYYRKLSEKIEAGQAISKWQYVLEDVKGMATQTYRLKKKLMKACHGIEIQEIGGKPRRKR
jgi:hypothetical protein